jgi:GT2 family glycosyltransferase
MSATDLNTSVIIPCYILPDKSGELLHFTLDCLESLRWHCGLVELVLVDNGSPVGGTHLRAEADLYIRNRRNLGYGPAVNQGLKLATKDWLVVANNDVVFTHNWVKTAKEAWQEGTGVVSSHLEDHDPEHKAGRQVAHWGLMFGALWMTRRDVVEAVGLLDEGYEFGHYEDKDYWRRLEEAGFELVKAGWCRHVGNATWGKLPYQQEIFLRNKRRFENRWGGD